jgi:hypothetical protein
MINLITYVFVGDIDSLFLFLSIQSLINELQISIFDTPKNDFFPQQIRKYKCVKYEDKNYVRKRKERLFPPPPS